jgi:type III secretory pathway component EscS
MGDFLLQMADGLVVFLNAILHRFILSLHLSPVVLHLLNAITQLDVLELDHSVKLYVVLKIRDL